MPPGGQVAARSLVHRWPRGSSLLFLEDTRFGGRFPVAEGGGQSPGLTPCPWLQWSLSCQALLPAHLSCLHPRAQVSLWPTMWWEKGVQLRGL